MLQVLHGVSINRMNVVCVSMFEQLKSYYKAGASVTNAKSLLAKSF